MAAKGSPSDGSIIGSVAPAEARTHRLAIKLAAGVVTTGHRTSGAFIGSSGNLIGVSYLGVSLRRPEFVRERVLVGARHVNDTVAGSPETHLMVERNDGRIVDRQLGCALQQRF